MTLGTRLSAIKRFVKQLPGHGGCAIGAGGAGAVTLRVEENKAATEAVQGWLGLRHRWPVAARTLSAAASRETAGPLSDVLEPTAWPSWCGSADECAA